MVPVITLKGIDQALSHLPYKNATIMKQRLISTLREFYVEGQPIEAVMEIDGDLLIRTLWETGDDPRTVRNRRRNLSSIKSSINSDLKRLFDEGKNPEGITIGPDNRFMMSDEAKDQILQNLKGTMANSDETSLDQLAALLTMIKEKLLDPLGLAAEGETDNAGIFEKMQSLIQALAEAMDAAASRQGIEGRAEEALGSALERLKGLGPEEDPGTAQSDGETSEAEEEAEEALEVVEDIDEPFEEDDLEVIEEEDLEAIDALEDEEATEDLEEVEDLEEAPEEEAPEEIEVLDDLEEVEADGDEELLEEDMETLAAEEVEDVLEEVEPEQDPEETLDEDDLEVIGEEDLEAIDALEDEEAIEDLEEVEELEEAPEEEAPEEIEVLDDLEEVEADGEEELPEEDAEALAADEVEDVLEEVEPEGDPEEALEEDDLEEIEDEDLDIIDALEDEDEPVEELDEIGDLEDAAEEDLEEVEALDDSDEIVEVDDEPDLEEEDALEEIEDENLGELAGIEGLGTGFSDGEYDISDDIREARLLAEQFDGYLGAMDRYFNQYLLIPEGTYQVGGGPSKRNGRPERRISLPAFYFGKYPVTNALFEIFVEKTGYVTTAEKAGHGTVYFARYRKGVDEKSGKESFTWNSSLMHEDIEGACWYHPSGPGSSLHHKRNHPVVQVSLEDAVAFSAWTGKRLPTEDEWEAASRTEKGLKYPWGNEWKKGACNNEESCTGDTTPVDQYNDFENAAGIVELVGNVWEWTLSSTNGGAQIPAGRNGSCAVKGGAWISRDGPDLLTRDQLTPDTRSNTLGFRCVAY